MYKEYKHWVRVNTMQSLKKNYINLILIWQFIKSGLASCFLILKYILYNKLGNPALSGYYIFSTNSQITKLKISKPT